MVGIIPKNLETVKDYLITAPSLTIANCDKTKIFRGYYVTPEGELYSIKTGAKKYTWLNKGRVNYYERAQFWIDGKKKNFYVHRIVAMLYLPDWDEDLEVDHINGNTLDNRPENLRMKMPLENRLAYMDSNKEFKEFNVFKVLRGTNCIFKSGTQNFYLG